MVSEKKIFEYFPPTCRCYICNMERIGLMAPAEMFENNDGRMDSRTPDACIYYKLTYEPTAQVS